MFSSSLKSLLAASAAALILAAFATQAGVPHGTVAAQHGAAQTFIVLAPDGEGVSRAGARVHATGGTIVASYDEIGVVIATAARLDFATAVVGDGVESAATTSGLGTLVESAEEQTVAAPDPATTSEDLWPYQWDMRVIKVAEAHSVTVGSPNVVVGVLDSGIDATHPDLASQIDHSLSASCLTGAADASYAAWQPTTSDHGTHVAGTIGAARNGFGMVGVAPGVRLAAVKVIDDNGFIYPEAAVCAFMWAAAHNFDVTNNSYFIDPWEFNCRNDPRQQPVWIAVQRALQYANARGVLTVASAGNSQFDLQHKFIDSSSPNDGSSPVETRTITNACVDLPAEAPSVLAVSATGPTGLKSYYSNYGLGVIDVAAPGGDARVPGTEPNGRVLSTTWPGNSWGYKQGTSMAAPHVAGVAALVRSIKPNLPPRELTALLQRTADRQACPGFAYTPPGANVVTQYCYGSKANNGFYGRGVINAYRAVTD